MSHSYALVGGINHGEKDLLSTITSNSLGYGAFAVGVFFLFGGYLIAGSAERSKTFTSFIKNRIWRIIPDLVIPDLAFLALMLTYVIRPLASSLPPCLYLFHYFNTYQISAVRPVLSYWIGTTAYVYKKCIRIPNLLALGSFIVFCISLPIGSH